MSVSTATDCQPESRIASGNELFRDRVLNEYRRTLTTRIAASACRIDGEFVEGMLVLTGEVGSYFHKQMAQESGWLVPGVEQVVNRVTVVR
jgi:osmotically-inducible protein OsmY